MDASYEFFRIIKRIVEITRPNLRHFYKIIRKGRIVQSYPCEGKYYADVKIIKNNNAEEHNEPVIQKVEIPVLWGGNNRGVICPPAKDSLCDVIFADGDPNFPLIANIRNENGTLPQIDTNEFIIQQEDGVYIKIDKENQILSITPSNYKVQIGGNAYIEAKGDIYIQSDKNIDAYAKGVGKLKADMGIFAESNALVHIKAPFIELQGMLRVTGYDGGSGLSYLSGDFMVDGNIHTSKDVKAKSISLKDHSHFCPEGGTEKPQEGSLEPSLKNFTEGKNYKKDFENIHSDFIAKNSIKNKIHFR